MESRNDWNASELLAHAGWVRSLALSLVRDAAQADDLLQDTLVAALERRPAGDRPLRPWLRRVLRNRAAFRRRGEEHRREREERASRPEALPSSAELLLVAEAHARLVQALMRLRDPYRTVLLLRFYEELTPGEIARRQGLPAATVRSHLRRGLAELRSALDDLHEGDRRAWSLALVPLAAQATRPPAPLLFPTLRAMHPITRILLGSSVVVLAGVLVVSRLEPATPSPASPPALAAAEPRSIAVEPSPAGARESVPLPIAQDGEPVRGLLRDSGGAPLPEFELRVGLGMAGLQEDPEILWTDQDGHFEGTRPYRDGDVLLIQYEDHPAIDILVRESAQTFLSAGGVVAGFRFGHEKLPLELKTIVGPTFLLVLDAPFDCSTAELRATLEVADGALGSLLRAPVRGGATPWVRFSWNAGSYLTGDRPWRLTIGMEDGLWSGAATVTPRYGRHDGPVPITLAPSARLDVVLHSSETLVDPVVAIEALTDGTRHDLIGTETFQLDHEAHGYPFSLGGLAAGEYRLLVSTDGFEQDMSTVTLVAGEVLASDVQSTDPSVGVVRGELRSLSGAYDEEITLHLMCAANGHDVLQLPRWEDRDGQKVAPFAFDNLPPGEYEVVILSWTSHFRWDAPADGITPPQEGLVLTCRDTDPTRTLEIRVHDAATGEPIRRASSSMTAEGCAIAQVASGGRGRSTFSGVPLDATLTWWAEADGYAPAFGDESAIVAEGETLVIEVGLDPGWGARIQATDRATGAPLPDVEILLDGEPAGVTDAEGRIDLFRPAEPERVELALAGWHFDSGQYDPAARKLDGFGPVHFVAFLAD